jgi:hypothetical protein
VVVTLAGRPLQDERASMTEHNEAGLTPAKVPRVHGYVVLAIAIAGITGQSIPSWRSSSVRISRHARASVAGGLRSS